jgi:hypothetical protein
MHPSVGEITMCDSPAVKRISRGVLGLAVTGALLVGCGSSTPKASQVRPTASTPTATPKPVPTTVPGQAIGKKAVEAFLKAGSVRITGNTAGFGPGGLTGTPAREPQTFDLRIGWSPARSLTAEGWVATRNTKVSVIRDGAKIYLQGDQAYNERLGPKATAVSGRWLLWTVLEFPSRTPTQNELLDSLTNIDGFVDTLLPFAGESSGDVVTSSGVQRSGSVTGTVLNTHLNVDNVKATLTVAATGRPLPLTYQVEKTRFIPAKTLFRFTDYGTGLSVTAPADAIDFNSVTTP